MGNELCSTSKEDPFQVETILKNTLEGDGKHKKKGSGVRKAFKSSHASQKPNAHTPQENAAPAATSVVRLTTAPGSFKGARTGTCTHTGVVLFEVHHDDHEDSDEETGAEEQPSGDSFPARSLVSKLAGGAEAFSQSTPNMSLSQHLQNNALVSKNLSPRTPPSHPSSTVEGHVIVAPLSDDDQLPPPTRIFSQSKSASDQNSKASPLLAARALDRVIEIKALEKERLERQMQGQGQGQGQEREREQQPIVTPLDDEQVQIVLQAQYATMVLQQQKIRQAQDERIRVLEEQLRHKLTAAASPSWRDRARQPLSSPVSSLLHESAKLLPTGAASGAASAPVGSSLGLDEPRPAASSHREWEQIPSSSTPQRTVEKPALHESLSFIPSISSTRDAEGEDTRRLAARLRVYYSFVAPASVERAFEVAFLYRNDIEGLNKALVSKYGKSLDSVTRISETTQMVDAAPAESLETTFDYLMRPRTRPPHSPPDEKLDTSVLNETGRTRGDAGFKETQKGKKGSSGVANVDVEEQGAMPEKAHGSAHKQHSSAPPQRFFDGVAPHLPQSGDKGSKSNPLAKHEIEDLSSTDLIRMYQDGLKSSKRKK